MSMRIRDIPLEDRHEIGRRLYEARKAPMTWDEAIDEALGESPVCKASTPAFAQLARDYALRSGQPWPPVIAHWMTFPGAMEREAERRAALKIGKGEDYRRRRIALGMTTLQIAALFNGCLESEIERIEREGPDDNRDHMLMMRALRNLESRASMPKPRDWLILSTETA